VTTLHVVKSACNSTTKHESNLHHADMQTGHFTRRNDH